MDGVRVKKKGEKKSESGFGLLKEHRGLHETWRKLHEEDWKHEQEEMDAMMKGISNREFHRRLNRVLKRNARAGKRISARVRKANKKSACL